MRVRRWRRAYLTAEYAGLFFGGAALYSRYLRGTSPIPGLVGAAAVATRYLRRQAEFDRGALWRAAALRGEGRSMAKLAGTSAVALTGLAALLQRNNLFDLPRRNPRLWLAVLVLYPAVSVYPQELIFRSFLFHRYAPVFGNGTGIVLASAAAFAYVHIMFGSWISVALSAAGGAIFAIRYQRTQSLYTASVEHSIYGILVFTVGLGTYFYHGTAGENGSPVRNWGFR
ncbi:CPBP family intramembrane glutamic endopeptidase [Nocardia brasiliensis]|uniref:CPBP family intramembrane glutamic endopeptidase n=1 Tax=Nocardia brasiliensis TaxID=37326 RepID=UPI003D8DEB23